MNRIIYTKHIPFGRYAAITICEWVFARREYAPLTKTIINHECIHIAQCREMLYIGFYIWYVLEFLVRFIQKHDRHVAYRAISFEKEAYDNEKNKNYLKERSHYRWRFYL